MKNLEMPAARKTPVWRKYVVLFLLSALAAGAGLYWRSSGSLVLEGKVGNSLIPVRAEVRGTVRSVPAAPGMRVQAGDPLVQLDDAPYRAALSEAEQNLARIAAFAPAEKFAVPNPDGTPGESLEQRLVRLTQEETAARQAVEVLSTQEANAAVEAARLKTTASHPIKAADAAKMHASVQARLSQSRTEFERISLERAAASAELRRIKNSRQEPPAGSVEALQKRQAILAGDRAAAASRDLQAAVLRAPADGTVASVEAMPGGTLETGQPAAYIAAAQASVFAYAGQEDVLKLRPGTLCTIQVDGSKTELPGRVAAVTPRVPSSDAVLAADAADHPYQVNVLLDAPAEGMPEAPLLIDGMKATITVPLR